LFTKVFWEDGDGTASWDDPEEIIPAATDTTAVALD
jgi:hypothetical protein